MDALAVNTPAILVDMIELMREHSALHQHRWSFAGPFEIVPFISSTDYVLPSTILVGTSHEPLPLAFIAFLEFSFQNPCYIRSMSLFLLSPHLFSSPI
jgi:hypothetical protein